MKDKNERLGNQVSMIGNGDNVTSYDEICKLKGGNDSSFSWTVCSMARDPKRRDW